jgi:hypothetical protein
MNDCSPSRRKIYNNPVQHVQLFYITRITDRLFKSNLTFGLFVFLLCRMTSGAFTIDSSTPTLRIILNEHAIFSITVRICRVISGNVHLRNYLHLENILFGLVLNPATPTG